jgi:hypothetical protein
MTTHTCSYFCEREECVRAQQEERRKYMSGNHNLRGDRVNHPDHYTAGDVECIDALAAATVNKHGIEAVCVGNIIKYLWRYEAKGGLEDVRKAQWYLNRLLCQLEKEGRG